MQIGEEAIVNFRSHRSSRLENAALLSAALELQILVTKCASGADGTDMGGLFEELLSTAAQQRFRSLCFKFSAEAGWMTVKTRLHYGSSSQTEALPKIVKCFQYPVIRD